MYLQNLRKAFLPLPTELYPIHNEKAMVKAFEKVKEQHSHATFDDAKDYHVMLSLDKKIGLIHGNGKITGPHKKKRDK